MNFKETLQWLINNDDFDYKEINGVDVPTYESIAKVLMRFKEDGWIKCSDRQPDETGKYWVYRESDGKQHREKFNGSGWSTNHNVITHWQPLPKAPK